MQGASFYYIMDYRHTLEIPWVQFQTIAIKQVKNFFGFLLHIKFMFTLYCRLLKAFNSIMS